MKDTVISCGGGTPCFGDNMADMNKHGITVYLKMEAEALKHRLTHPKKKRPLLMNVSEENLLTVIKEETSTPRTLLQAIENYAQWFRCRYEFASEKHSVFQLIFKRVASSIKMP